MEKKEKLADAIQEKKRVVEEGEDVERSKNMDYSIEDNENWEKKLKQKARNARFEFDGAFSPCLGYLWLIKLLRR